MGLVRRDMNVLSLLVTVELWMFSYGILRFAASGRPKRDGCDLTIIPNSLAIGLGLGLLVKSFTISSFYLAFSR